jgi:hypothetical protein
MIQTNTSLQINEGYLPKTLSKYQEIRIFGILQKTRFQESLCPLKEELVYQEVKDVRLCSLEKTFALKIERQEVDHCLKSVFKIADFTIQRGKGKVRVSLR